MARKQTIIVTGDKELDARLRAFEPKVRNKFARKALREATKRVREEFIKRVPVDTGALKRSSTVRSLKRSTKRIGAMVVVNTTKLYDIRQKGSGKRPQWQGQDFYYPAVIEYGSINVPAQAPMRKALYENKEYTVSRFKASLREAIASA